MSIDYLFNLHQIIPLAYLHMLTFMESQNFEIASQYFFYNTTIILIAALWGCGFSTFLIKDFVHRAPLNLSTGIFICISYGIAIILAVIFVLVMFRALTATSLIYAFSCLSLASFILIFKDRKNLTQILKPFDKKSSLISIFVIILLAAYQLSAVTNWTTGDATSFHVPYAEFFLLNDGLSTYPEHLIYPFHSLNLSLLYALGLLIENNLSFLQTIHALFLTLTIFGVFIFCRDEGFSPFIIFSVMASLPGIYIVHYSQLTANADLGSMYFIFCCVFLLRLWFKYSHQYLLVLSATTFGMAIGTKYLMGIFALPIAISIFLINPKSLRAILTYGLITALWGLWWYIRNFIYTGNPVHPFASNIFGYYIWNEQDIISQFNAWNPSIPRNILGLLLMPYYAFMEGVMKAQGAFLIILLIYLSTGLSWLHTKEFNFLLLFCWIYLISWVFGTQDPRHLISIMPLVLIHTGGTIHHMISVSPLQKKYSAVILFLLSSIPAFIFIKNIEKQLISLTNSDIGMSYAEIDKHMRYDPVYDLISHANEIFNPEQTVYEFGMRNARCFYKGKLVGTQFGPHGYFRIIGESTKPEGGISPSKLERLLKERYSADGFIIPNPTYMPYKPEEFDRAFIMMYRNELGAIYKFRS